MNIKIVVFNSASKLLSKIYYSALLRAGVIVKHIDQADQYSSPRHTTTFRLRYLADFLEKHRGAITRFIEDEFFGDS